MKSPVTELLNKYGTTIDELLTMNLNDSDDRVSAFKLLKSITENEGYAHGLKLVLDNVESLLCIELISVLSPILLNKFGKFGTSKEAAGKELAQQIISVERASVLKKCDCSKFFDSLIKSSLFVEAYLKTPAFEEKDAEHLLFAIIRSNDEGFSSEFIKSTYMTLLKINQENRVGAYNATLSGFEEASLPIDADKANKLLLLISEVEKIVLKNSKVLNDKFSVFLIVKLFSINGQDVATGLQKTRSRTALKAYLDVMNITPLDFMTSTVLPENVKKQAVKVLSSLK